MSGSGHQQQVFLSFSISSCACFDTVILRSVVDVSTTKDKRKRRRYSNKARSLFIQRLQQ
eukprot:2262077-Amphidinium_carterae.1